jgi:hypothetical protein
MFMIMVAVPLECKLAGIAEKAAKAGAYSKWSGTI